MYVCNEWRVIIIMDTLLSYFFFSPVASVVTGFAAADAFPNKAGKFEDWVWRR